MQLLSIPIPNRRPTALAAAAAILAALITSALMLTTPGNLVTAQQGSDPDSTRAGAVSLGDITAQHKAKGKNHSIDGVNDVVDYFSFSLTATREVMVKLKEMERNADLFIEDQDGNELASSTEADTADEAIFHELDAGTYYIRVEAMQRGSNIYKLRYKATEPVQEEDDPTPANSPATGAPAITGTPERGRTLTADTQGISDQNGLTNPAFTYQWLRDDAEIPGATGRDYTLTAADVGSRMKVKVTFTDDDGYEETLTSTATEAVNSPATGAPSISGTAEVGRTLTADTSTISDQNGLTNPGFTYQWLRDDAEVPGSTGEDHLLTANDVGSRMKVRVNFMDDDGHSETLTSMATQVVNSPATGAPTINGTAEVGRTLTADTTGVSDQNGLTNPAFAFQWLRDDASVPGATGQDYTLTSDDVGSAIKVRVSFTDDDGYSETITSAGTDAVTRPANVAATGAPTITGTEQVGEVLTADASGIADENGLENARFAYQWLRNDGNSDAGIQGATGPSYTLTTADVSHTIKVKVNFVDDDGYEETVTSAATGTVNRPPNALPTGLPTITGTAEVGEVLRADTSGIEDANGLSSPGFTYQWLRKDGNTDTPISGETGSTYTVLASDTGSAFKVSVSFTDDHGYAHTLVSDATSTAAASTYSGRTFVELSGGSFHMCGIATDGSIHCWGEGNRGQTDAPAGTYKALASGSAHTCAIATDGSISCWGWNTWGQASPPTGTFKSISSHTRHSCAIAVDDTIACWGYHSFYQNASPEGTYKSMAIGWEHTCTIKTDDTISCWGLNDQGQGNFPSGAYKAITAGFVHTCAIKSDDSVICRGMNNRGQTEAPAGSYVSISAGEYHTCAIATDGTIACWGDSRSGKTDAPGGNYKSIVAKNAQTCAIATDDSVSCWGSDLDGQTDAPEGTFTATALSAYHTCGIATDGRVKCWGWNADARSDTPSGTFESAVMGREHACAITSDDTVTCWGYNGDGQTDAPAGTYQRLAAGMDHTCAIATDDTITCWGYGGNGQTKAPSGTYQELEAGHDHTCAIATDDTITCWGLRANGRTQAPTGTYKAVAGGKDYTCAIATDDTITCWGGNGNGRADAPAGAYQSMSAGNDHTCAVATDGSVACWGNNGDGKSRAADGTYRSVSAGEHHTCAVATDDTVTCWGYNRNGQADAPAGTYRSVGVGQYHTCAVATDDTVVCWGNERGGRTDAPDGTYRSIVADTHHTLAIATDGTLVAWPGLPEGVTWVDGDL